MAESIEALDRWVRGDKWPHVECPVCAVGALVPSFLKHTPSAASMAIYDASGDAERIVGQFHGVLDCTFPQCGEHVTVAGDLEVSYDVTDEGRTKEFEFFRLRYAAPALTLIKPPPGAPDKIVAAIRSASSVLWVDPNAAANRLRVATDELLTAQKVRRTTINKAGKREPLRTHARIETFRKTRQKAGDALLAVKWIGNVGSHDSELSTSDVLNGASMLGYALRLLYDKTDVEIEREVRKVNARKGLPRKSAPSKR
jgi:hypothetical protein